MTSANRSSLYRYVFGESVKRIRFSHNHIKVLLILAYYKSLRAKDLEKMFGSKSVYLYLADLEKIGFVVKERRDGRSVYYSITEEGMRAAESMRLYFRMQDVEKSLHEEIRQLAVEAGITRDMRELDVYSKILAKAFQEEVSQNPDELNELLKDPRAKILSLIKSAKENKKIKSRLHSMLVLMSQCYHVELDKLQLRRLKDWFNTLIEKIYTDQIKFVIYPTLMLSIYIIVSLLLAFL